MATLKQVQVVNTFGFSICPMFVVEITAFVG
jgi:hypothetical protein